MCDWLDEPPTVWLTGEATNQIRHEHSDKFIMTSVWTRLCFTLTFLQLNRNARRTISPSARWNLRRNCQWTLPQCTAAAEHCNQAVKRLITAVSVCCSDCRMWPAHTQISDRYSPSSSHEKLPEFLWICSVWVFKENGGWVEVDLWPTYEDECAALRHVCFPSHLRLFPTVFSLECLSRVFATICM